MFWLFFPRPGNIIQIEFGVAPEVLVGAQVLIDGDVAGTLERRDARTLNGFEVEPGAHTVEIRVEGIASEPFTADPSSNGGSTRLMVDFAPERGDDGVWYLIYMY
jgi:hypothetical protein